MKVMKHMKVRLGKMCHVSVCFSDAFNFLGQAKSVGKKPRNVTMKVTKAKCSFCFRSVALN